MVDGIIASDTPNAVNLGKWVLRYLFANLIDEEIKRDDVFRTNLLANVQQSNGLQQDNAPAAIQPPTSQISGWQRAQDDFESAITPRPVNGSHPPVTTPGLSIGVATPAAGTLHHGIHLQNHLPSTAEETTDLEKRTSHQSNPRMSTDKSGDYFSSNPTPSNQHDDNGKMPSTTGDGQSEGRPRSLNEGEKEDKPKESGSLFGKKFRMNFPKKLGRSSVEAKPAVVDEKSEESDKSSEKEDKIVEDNFFGVVQKIRNDYEEQLQSTNGSHLASGIHASLPTETPVLKPPPLTTVIIQEDRPDSGGVADLYRGSVSSVGQDADLIERTAPMWLGELLLRVCFFRTLLNSQIDVAQNQIPFKDTVKVSFVLQPYRDLLPSIASADGLAFQAMAMVRINVLTPY